ncbi:hypothetical protein GUJ93_ZPchr0007g4551 [Zizania palustris]|uniref:Uncharacterized protein n=1 Tax=Zizania palustris TaxID=103762 RepID=A0A8J5TE61_ZIZPA|nr:hypothetical protein GUJ93_ZPchr0007g4551 [Zizania palustris]
MEDLTVCGYCYVMLNLRGYDGTTTPSEPTSYTIFHIVGGEGLIALLDDLKLPQVITKQTFHHWTYFSLIAMKVIVFLFLNLVGVGFKARTECEGRELFLKLGYSHKVPSTQGLAAMG